MESSNFEVLHPELQAAIMSQLPTLGSLYSLIRASPRLFQVFLDRKQQIFSKMALRRFHPAVLSDALATVRASQLEEPLSRDLILQFLGGLPLQHDVHIPPVLPLTTAVALCKLHEDVDYFTTDFSKRSLRMLDTVSKSSHQGDPLPAPKWDKEFKPHLSSVEIGRLQRAFCRFETYRHLFSQSDTEHADITVEEQSQLLLQLFPKWQIEEIACVRDHLIHRLCETFDSMEEDFIKRELAGKNPVNEESFEGRWDAEDYWYSSFAKGEQTEYMEHLLSLGLPFLRQVFQAGGEARNNMITSNRRCRYRFFLSAALQEPEQENERNDQDEIAYRNGVITAFGVDAIDRCNDGWVWGHEFRPALMWACGSRKRLRSRGYVFWDHQRLEVSGILKYKPRDIADDDVDETSRFDELSVEERVEGPRREHSSRESVGDDD